MSFLFTDSDRNTRQWRRNQGWTEKATPIEADKICSKSTKEVFMTPKMVLQGAAWTASELSVAIDRATENGWQVAPLKAEQSLRIALSLACLIIPLLGLSLSLKRREWGTSKLVGMAVIAASVFWLALAAAWNGAALGAWSPIFVSVIVPGVFFALGSALILVFEKV